MVAALASRPILLTTPRDSSLRAREPRCGSGFGTLDCAGKPPPARAPRVQTAQGLGLAFGFTLTGALLSAAPASAALPEPPALSGSERLWAQAEEDELAEDWAGLRTHWTSTERLSLPMRTPSDAS